MQSYFRGCRGKRPYKFKQHAQKKIEQRADPGLEIYSCIFCGYWHIGHGKAKKQMKRKDK